MSDLISRQAAISIADDYMTDEAQDIRDRIVLLPSAERRGKWIETLFGWRCSVCGEEQDYSVYFKHCPNCGARMEVE